MVFSPWYFLGDVDLINELLIGMERDEGEEGVEKKVRLICCLTVFGGRF